MGSRLVRGAWVAISLLALLPPGALDAAQRKKGGKKPPKGTPVKKGSPVRPPVRTVPKGLPPPSENHIVAIDGLGLATSRYARVGTNAFGAVVMTGSVRNPTGEALGNASIEAVMTDFGGQNPVRGGPQSLGSIRPGDSVPFKLQAAGLRGVGSWALTVRFTKSGAETEDVFAGGVGDPAEPGGRSKKSSAGTIRSVQVKTPPSNLLPPDSATSRPIRYSALRAAVVDPDSALEVRGAFTNSGDLPVYGVTLDLDCVYENGEVQSLSIPLMENVLMPGESKEFASRYPDSAWYRDIREVALQTRFQETTLEELAAAEEGSAEEGVEEGEPGTDPGIPAPAPVPGGAPPGYALSASYQAPPGQSGNLFVTRCRLAWKTGGYDVSGEIRNDTGFAVAAESITVDLLDASGANLKSVTLPVNESLAPKTNRPFACRLESPPPFARFGVAAKGTATKIIPKAPAIPAPAIPPPAKP